MRGVFRDKPDVVGDDVVGADVVGATEDCG